MTSLGRLNVLLAEGTELCAPPDSVFQTWLEGVDNHRIATCPDGDPPMAYLTQVQSQEFPVPVLRHAGRGQRLPDRDSARSPQRACARDTA